MIKHLINILEAKSKSKVVEIPNALPYVSLSPSNDAEGFEEYNKALLWAITNSKQKAITNIALTGPYGSGKSSIIRTFKNKNPHYKLLEISLATFPNPNTDLNNSHSYEKKNEVEDNNSKNNILLNQIEISILNQIFHRDKNEGFGILSDSRFYKINIINKRNVLFYSILFSFWLLSLYYILKEEDFKNTFRFLKKTIILDLLSNYVTWINYGVLMLFLFGIYGIINLFINIIYKVKLNKVSFFDTEIELSTSANKSILNQYIEEIIYFFERNSKYSIVVIEDLDRFDRPEIFTKLREINYILNSSEKLKGRSIIFLYAVKDDMFKEKDRAKFFDFIIPVIPIINFSNSSQKLLKISKDNNYDWNKLLIQDVSYFIDDMRLLYNICNEYYIYKSKLNERLDKNKLLSVLVYKNLFPRDFAESSENKGVLIDYFQKRHEYLATIKNDLNGKISALKSLISSYEKEHISKIEELRELYISKYLIRIGSPYTFFLGGRSLALQELKEEVNFEKLITGEIIYRRDHYGYDQKVPSFTEIEKHSSSGLSYKERSNLIFNGKKEVIGNIFEEINKLEEKIRSLNKTKFIELINDESIYAKYFYADDKINKLLILLLKNGHIDETYIDYISIFHEGTLMKSDYEFLINLRTKNTLLPFDYKLHNYGNILEAISDYDYTTRYIINFGLIEYLLINNKNTVIENSVFEQFLTDDRFYYDFIVNYFKSDYDLNVFAKAIMKYNFVFLEKLISDDSIEKNHKKNIIKALLDNMNVGLLNATDFKNLIQYILNDKDYFQLISNKDKLKNLAYKFNIKFKNLDPVSTPDECIYYIFKAKLFALNNHMLQLIIETCFKDHYDIIEYQNNNYTYLKSLNSEHLFSYIIDHCNEYCENVLLNDSQLINDHETDFFNLLSIPKLNKKNQEKLINKRLIPFQNISNLDITYLLEHLLVIKKIKPSWQNLYYLYGQIGNNDGFSLFINEFYSDLNYEMTSFDGLGVDSDFCDYLYNNLEISVDAFRIVCANTTHFYGENKLSSLGDIKIKIMIEKGAFEVVLESFEMLYNYNKTLSYYFYLKNDKLWNTVFSHFFRSNEDIVEFISLASTERVNIIIFLNYNYSNINIENNNISMLVAKILKINGFENISKEFAIEILINDLLNKNLSDELMINLFSLYHQSISLDNVSVFIKNLSMDLNVLLNTNKKPKIRVSPHVRSLLDILKNKGYVSSYQEDKNNFRVHFKRS